MQNIPSYALVICMPGPLRAGDSGDTAGLKCQALISDESRDFPGGSFPANTRSY